MKILKRFEFYFNLIVCVLFFRKASAWEDTLTWCPSQCYYRFRIRDSYFILYLRWRWSDPWSADLIETRQSFRINGEGSSWWSLGIRSFTAEDDLDMIKRESMRKAIVKIARLRSRLDGHLWII